MTDDMKFVRQWSGTHKGIQYEIKHWGKDTVINDGYGIWNYYVYINELQLSPEDFAEFWLEPKSFMDRSSGTKTAIYQEYDAKFSGADWHGGVTFYSKVHGFDGEPKGVKIGCDYSHVWDDQARDCYDERWLKADAEKTVERLVEMYRFKKACSYTGKYIWLEDGVEHEGRFYCKEGLEKYLAWKK
jgi:hypothetical protein